MRRPLPGLLALLIPLALFALPALADPVVPGEEHCVVNVAADDSLNLRGGPGTGFRVLTTLRYGQCGIFVTGGCRGNWCPVEDGHVGGWANRRFLAMVSPALYCVTGVARGDRLNLRAYPSSSSRVIAQMGPRACGIAFLPYAVGNWQKVRWDGYEGWAARRFLSGE